MSDEELTKLEEALKAKDENTVTDITISHTNAERVKIRDDYKAKFNRELFDDFEKYLKSDLKDTLVEIYKDPVEYDTDLLYKAMKGIGTNDEILIEVISFRPIERLNQIKEKFKEKYGKELIPEIKSETSGDYRDTLIALFETERSKNKLVKQLWKNYIKLEKVKLVLIKHLLLNILRLYLLKNLCQQEKNIIKAIRKL